MDRNIVILAGGASSRMKSSASPSPLDQLQAIDAATRPKGMIRVGVHQRPLLDYLMHTVEQSGYDHVLIVVGEHDTSIREHYDLLGGSSRFPGLKIECAAQKIPPGFNKPLGTADALRAALDAMPSWSGQQVTVCNSDNVYSRNAFRLLLEDGHENAMIDYSRSGLHYDNERISQWAVTVKDNEGFLIDLVDRPSPEEIRRMQQTQGRVGVSMNLWKFSYNRVLPFLESVPLHATRQEKELNAAVRMMVVHYPRSLYAIPLSEHVIDLTSRTDIPVVEEYVRKEFPSL